MERQPDYQNICERYLLGELSEPEAQQLEESYFADDELFEQFLAIKDDMLDAYSRGELTGHKRQRFKEHYLASDSRRQKVDEARDFIQVVTATASAVGQPSSHVVRTDKPSSTGWFRRILRPPISRGVVAAASVLLIALVWIVVSQIQDRTARRTAEQARTTPSNVDVSGNHPAEPAPTSGPNRSGDRKSDPSLSPNEPKALPPVSSRQFAAVTLLPYTSRDAASADVLTLTPKSNIVRLTLVFNSEVQGSFEVSVRTVDGQQVFRQRGLKASSSDTGKTVTLTFNSSFLTRQDYIAALRARDKSGATETISEYYFRVENADPQGVTHAQKE